MAEPAPRGLPSITGIKMPSAAHPLADIDTEQMLIGALLADPAGRIPIAKAIVAATDFAEPLHQMVVDLIYSFDDEGRAITPTTLNAWIKHNPAVQDANRLVGEPVPPGREGMFYLSALARGAPAGANVAALAELVLDFSMRRQAMDAMGEAEGLLTGHGLAAPQPIMPALEIVVKVSDAISEQQQARSAQPSAGEQGDILLKQISAQAVTDQQFGMRTNFGELDDVLGGLYPETLIVAGGRPGMGKAQPLTARIRTQHGWTVMGALQPGSVIASPAGTAIRVSHVHPQGVKPIYRLMFADGRTAEATGDHLWRVYSKHWLASRVISTLEIKRLLGLVRYRKWLHIDLVADSGGMEKRLPLDPYLVGVLLGDGGIKYRVGFTNFDHDVCKRVAKALPSGVNLCERKRGQFDIATPRTGGTIKNPVAAALKAVGLFGLGSGDKFIPVQYLEGSREQRAEMLAGLLDTDGTVERDGTIRFCSISERLTVDFAHLVRSLGGTCISRKKKTQGKDAYISTVRIPDAVRYFYSTRKRARLPKRYQYNNLRLRIDAVEECGRAEAQCITVEGADHLYVTEDFVVTHNSVLGENLVRQAALQGVPADWWSIEMPARECTARLICDQDYDDAIDGGFKPLHYEDLVKMRINSGGMERSVLANGDIRGLDISIFSEDRVTMSRIAAVTRARVARNPGLRLIVIDHLHILMPEERYRGRRVDELSEITGAAKRLAKRTGSIVVLLAQLSRDIEKRDDKRPFMADFRDSGSIEQDADVVLGLYRGEYYANAAIRSAKTDEQKTKAVAEYEACVKTLEIDVLKQRSGQTKTTKCFIDIASSAIRAVEPVPGNIAQFVLDSR